MKRSEFFLFISNKNLIKKRQVSGLLTVRNHNNTIEKFYRVSIDLRLVNLV